METGSATHGITKFADLTTEEFKASHLNYDPIRAALVNKTMATDIEPLAPGSSASQDWVRKKQWRDKAPSSEKQLNSIPIFFSHPPHTPDWHLHYSCEGPRLLRKVRS
jgi:hypothetical protein